jgi:hypothetical protein
VDEIDAIAAPADPPCSPGPFRLVVCHVSSTCPQGKDGACKPRQLPQGGEKPTPAGWADAFEQATTDDPLIAAHGRHYSCKYMLDMEEERFIVEMHEGRAEQIKLDPPPLDDYEFALRAPAATWRGMGERVPRPMFHGIWAASFREGAQHGGRPAGLMQNLNCFTRQVELLRETGVPV